MRIGLALFPSYTHALPDFLNSFVAVQAFLRREKQELSVTDGGTRASRASDGMDG